MTASTLQRLRDIGETGANPDENVRGRKLLDCTGNKVGTTDGLMVDASQNKKELRVRFAHVLTPQQLHELVVLPTGSRLEQGTHYLDLANLAAGELVAMAGMEVQPDHYYVAEKDTEYALWDTLKTLPHAARTSSTPPSAADIAPLNLTTHSGE